MWRDRSDVDISYCLIVSAECAGAFACNESVCDKQEHGGACALYSCAGVRTLVVSHSMLHVQLLCCCRFA
jgi:hypothetical protein